MTGGSLPPPELLLEVESGGLGACVGGVAVMTGGGLPPDWGWTGMVPPLPLLELVAFMPPDWELVAFMPPDWDWIGTGIKSPPLPSVGLLPPLPLLELVAFVPPDWELAAEVALGIGACVGLAMVTESWLGSGCFSAGCFSLCGCFTAGCVCRYGCLFSPCGL